MIITRTQTIYRRLDELVGVRVGQAIPFYLPSSVTARSAIVDRIERNIATLRVLIGHEVVKPGRWA